MSYEIIKGKIQEQDVDIIVNAANSIGWMGGVFGRLFELPGVAEALHYNSNGKIEKEARKIARQNKIKKGDIYVTSAHNLNAKYIIHAATMTFPGQHSNIEIVEMLIPKIIDKSRELGAKSVSIPLLGSGTGNIPKEKVMALYDRYFSEIEDFKIYVVVL